jgi:hypothetical protein
LITERQYKTEALASSSIDWVGSVVDVGTSFNVLKTTESDTRVRPLVSFAQQWHDWDTKGRAEAAKELGEVKVVSAGYLQAADQFYRETANAMMDFAYNIAKVHGNYIGSYQVFNRWTVHEELMGHDSAVTRARLPHESRIHLEQTRLISSIRKVRPDGNPPVVNTYEKIGLFV